MARKKKVHPSFTASGPYAGRPNGFDDEFGAVLGNGHLVSRETGAFAAGILIDPGASGEDRQRAFRCLQNLSEWQIRTGRDPLPDPGEIPLDPTGTWYYTQDGKHIDYNWADFIGTDLVHAVIRDAVPDHGDWPGGLYDRVLAMLRCAADCTHRRQLRLSYTNPTAMSCELEALYGELSGDLSYVEHAREHLTRWIAFTKRAGCFEEFNSNTYGGITLPHLAALAEYVRDPAVRELALKAERLYWDHVIDFYHQPTGEMCMPRARTYHDRFAESMLHAYLAAVVARLRPGTAFSPTLPGVAESPALAIRSAAHPTEEQLDRLLAPVTEPRSVRRLTEWIGEDHVGPLDQVPPVTDQPCTRRREIRAYHHPQFCLGSVSEIDSWTQRRALGGYAVHAAVGAPAMLSWKPDIAVKKSDIYEPTQLWPLEMYFNLSTIQRDNGVLACLGPMPTDGGWLAGSHWRQRVAGMVKHIDVAFGFDLDMCGVEASSVNPPVPGEPWYIPLGDAELTLLLFGGACAGTPVNPAVTPTPDGLRIDLLHVQDFDMEWENPCPISLVFFLALHPRGERPNLQDPVFSARGCRIAARIRVDDEDWRMTYDPPSVPDHTQQALIET